MDPWREEDLKVATTGNAYDTRESDDQTGLVWNDGVGTLPGSDLKFRRTDRGDIEVIMDATSISNETTKPVNMTLGSQIPREQMSAIQQNGMAEPRVQDWSSHRPQHISELPPNSFFQDSFVATNSFDMNGNVDQNNRLYQAMTSQTQITGASGAMNMTVDRAKIKLEGRDSMLTRNEAISQGVQEFSWDHYLKENNIAAAPESAFREIFGRNPFPPPMKFAVGDMLECVDPLHQSLICVVSVVEVKGTRMRLHFEGYSTLHDFWMNSEEKLMFPCGFCKKSGRKLHPPKGYDSDAFDWETYAAETGKRLTSEDKFRDDIQKCYEKNSDFKIGQKLEAIDRKNPEFICVATVNDIIDDRILIHFDGWNHNFDYWCDHTSNYVHPMGWCHKTGKTLSVPYDYGEVENFSWDRYLEETKSTAAKESAFSPRTSHGLDVELRLEIVDKRNPILVRVATVIEKNAYQIKIHFDGWDALYDYWIDVDSTDLHPARWCSHTGHPLQPNITEEENRSWQAGCPVPGCRGLGHIKGSKFVGHHSEYGCPYSSKNLDSYPIQDRIMPRRGPKPSSLMSRRVASVPMDNDKNNYDGERRRTQRKISRHSTSNITDFDNFRSSYNDDPPPEKRRKSIETKVQGSVASNEKSLYYTFHNSWLWGSFPNKHLAIYWEQCTKLMPSVTSARASEICKWSAIEVAKFVEKLTGQENYGEKFLNEEIDGEAFLLLSQSDLSDVLKIKLGPTLKIHGAILYARSNG